MYSATHKRYFFIDLNNVCIILRGINITQTAGEWISPAHIWDVKFRNWKKKKINIINGASKRALDKTFQLVSVYIKQIFFHSSRYDATILYLVHFNESMLCDVDGGKSSASSYSSSWLHLETLLQVLWLWNSTKRIRKVMLSSVNFISSMCHCCTLKNLINPHSFHIRRKNINCLHPDKSIHCRL